MCFCGGCGSPKWPLSNTLLGLAPGTNLVRQLLFLLGRQPGLAPIGALHERQLMVVCSGLRRLLVQQL